MDHRAKARPERAWQSGQGAGCVFNSTNAEQKIRSILATLPSGPGTHGTMSYLRTFALALSPA